MKKACYEHATSNLPMKMSNSRRERRLMFQLPRRVSGLEAGGMSRSLAVAADELGVTPDHAAELIELRSGWKTIGDGDDAFEPAADEQDPLASRQHDQVRAVIETVMSTLPRDDRRLLERRLRGDSLEGLAERYGTSRAKIGRRLSVILGDVRAEFDVRGLTLSDLLP